MIALFTVDEQAKSVSQAESMIAKHNEHKVRHNVTTAPAKIDQVVTIFPTLYNHVFMIH